MTSTIKKTLFSMAAMLPLCLIGSTGNSSKPLIAHASTLTPVAQPVQRAALVEETIVYANQLPNGVAGFSGGQKGGRGYTIAGNNCVQCVKAMTGRGQNGNAGSWSPSSSTPWIGAIMIFYPGEQGASYAGHVGVVVGINADGSIELAHCNWRGQTTFRSTGKFY